MKATIRGVLGLLIVLGVATAQQKSSNADETALKMIEEKWDAASLKGDAAALATIFADGFVTTDPEGKVRSKAETLARVKSGEVKFQSAKVDDLKVSLYGDAAVVTGRWKGKFVENGKTVDTTERFSDFFVRQNGQWRCVSSHASTLK